MWHHYCLFYSRYNFVQDKLRFSFTHSITHTHPHAQTHISHYLVQTLPCSVWGSKEDQNSMEESDCMTDLAECVLPLLRQTGLKKMLSTAWDNSKPKNLRALRDLKHGKNGCWHHHHQFYSTPLLCPWANVLTWIDSSASSKGPWSNVHLIRRIMVCWCYYELQAAYI